jgi:hypothetical protein
MSTVGKKETVAVKADGDGETSHNQGQDQAN